MFRLVYKIAEEIVEIDPDFPLSTMVLRNFAPFVYEPRNHEAFQPPHLKLIVHEGEPGHDPEIIPKNLIHSFETDDGDCFFYKIGDNYFFLTEREPALPISMLMRRGEPCVHMYTPDVNRLNRSNFLFSIWMALSFTGIPKGLSPVHSSVIVYKGAAILILGESGTGKSTHTKLWTKNIEGSFILNDDSPFVRASKPFSDNGFIYTCGSPWSGKGRVFINETYPVAAIVRLKQGSVNKMIKLNVLESFAALYPSFPPALAKDELFSDDICKIISEIIKSIPVYELEALPDRESALLVREMVFSHLHKHN